MKFPGLIHFTFTLTLALNSKGQQWDINVPRKIFATLGSNVTIPCNFTYPPKHYTDDVHVFWKKPGRSNFHINDNDKNIFIFHPNDTFVLEKYRGKTKLCGNKDKGSCCLIIQNIKENELNMYVRLIAKDDQYSFRNKYVSIYVHGATPVTLNPDTSYNPSPSFETRTTTMSQKMSTTTYEVIFAPVAGLLLIVLLSVGTAFYIKKNRSKSFAREESVHYANVRSVSSNQVKREVCCAQQINKKLRGLEIDEPVYINLEASSVQTDERRHHDDQIYANMDHSEYKRN
ncbi:uncharacterized protein [Antennarius striatus]|uniref:uncharacterized protein n=1 Tax=Antennarius striatus TaxID=241820 RepID=UPI0035B28AA4